MISESVPEDRRALVAVDLGAESCRVSLLRWREGEPEIRLIHRAPNGPVFDREAGASGELRWALDRILAGVDDGLRKAAEAAPEGIRSVAVDGWAVDYVRLGADGQPISAPFCYRDVRTETTKAEAERLVPAAEHFARTGAQPLRINTVYQLMADGVAAIDAKTPWLLLPEFVLYRLGGRRVAEYTNATHTGLVDLKTGDWSAELFARLGLALEAAPPIVCGGTVVGKLSGPLASMPAFADTKLIAPACHDTASAIAAVTANLEHTAYLVSGTWSLVGTVVDRPVATAEALEAGFTNQGEVAGGYCFHTNVNGMWLLKQCLDHWCGEGRQIDLAGLIVAAEEVSVIPGLIDVDAPPLLLAGRMPEWINQELESKGFARIPDEPGTEAVFARVIFASLAKRYAAVLRHLESLTGRSFQQIAILGGGSRNRLLSRLTAESTGLPVFAGEAEGSTLGNFAVQLAAHEGSKLAASVIRGWAERLSMSSAAQMTGA